jgi:hypothetical protein
LAGCHFDLSEMNTYNSFIKSITFRMRVLTNEQAIANIISCVICQSENLIINSTEYIVNEILYEYRLMSGPKETKNEEAETNVINEWSKVLISKYNQDFVLDFINTIKSNRAKRYRKGDKSYLGL